MLSLEWPWILLLLPLPWLYRLLRSPSDNPSPALRAPLYGAMAQTGSSPGLRAGWRWLSLILLVIAWLAVLLAAARPTWIGDPVALPSNGRDLLLAVDISRSMDQVDMVLDGNEVDRLTTVKAVVGDFVERRTGDRLGLILFGTRPYLQTPLTFDRETLNQQLMEAQTGFAGGQTAIGDAIGLGVKRLQQRPENHRLMILLTDGANTAGEVQPIKAAEVAASEGVKVYTIGIGAEMIIKRSFFGSRRINPSADLDEKTLSTIAEKTGGQYFRARNPQELEAIYRELDRLEPVEQEAETLRPTKALFHWPLAAALIASLLLAALGSRGVQQ